MIVSQCLHSKGIDILAGQGIIIPCQPGLSKIGSQVAIIVFCRCCRPSFRKTKNPPSLFFVATADIIQKNKNCDRPSLREKKPAVSTFFAATTNNFRNKEFLVLRTASSIQDFQFRKQILQQGKNVPSCYYKIYTHIFIEFINLS